MSSYYDWAQRKIREHDANLPFAPENGQPLKFRIGDRVVFTNDNRIEFGFTITGIAVRSKDDLNYALGYRYLVNSSSPWFPVRESSLRLADTRDF